MNIKSIFETGYSFSILSETIMNHVLEVFSKERIFIGAYPVLLNELISIELLMKCVYFSDKGYLNKSYGHDLLTHFYNLSENIKEQIANNFSQYLNDNKIEILQISPEETIEISLIDTLNEFYKSFKVMRYGFEGFDRCRMSGCEALKFSLVKYLKDNYRELCGKQIPINRITFSDTSSGENDFTSKDIFDYADSFAYGVAFASEQTIYLDNNLDVLWAIFSNKGLTLELYLKCIYHIENNSVIYGHNLEKIFNKLKPKSKKLIRDYFNFYEKNISQLPISDPRIYGPASFKVSLNDASNAFVQYRYLYEKNIKSFIGYMPLKMSLLVGIKKLKPEWFPGRTLIFEENFLN